MLFSRFLRSAIQGRGSRDGRKACGLPYIHISVHLLTEQQRVRVENEEGVIYTSRAFLFFVLVCIRSSNLLLLCVSVCISSGHLLDD